MATNESLIAKENERLKNEITLMRDKIEKLSQPTSNIDVSAKQMSPDVKGLLEERNVLQTKLNDISKELEDRKEELDKAEKALVEAQKMQSKQVATEAFATTKNSASGSALADSEAKIKELTDENVDLLSKMTALQEQLASTSKEPATLSEAEVGSPVRAEQTTGEFDWTVVPLPKEWELCWMKKNGVMKAYYADHARKITQWRHPAHPKELRSIDYPMGNEGSPEGSPIKQKGKGKAWA